MKYGMEGPCIAMGDGDAELSVLSFSGPDCLSPKVRNRTIAHSYSLFADFGWGPGG